MPITPDNLGSLITAIGALGTASFALVDSTKIGRNGGVSNSGFACIQTAVQQFFPNATRDLPAATTGSGTPPPNDAKKLLDILHGNWINGSPLADQKAIAKSLIKLRLTETTAADFADATSVDAVVLTQVAKKISTGASMDPAEINVYGRFDLALTAILDEGYQRADQKYRNSAKVLASIFAVALSLVGTWVITDPNTSLHRVDYVMAILCGLLATPLAPIAKDLTSALAAGVKVAQAIRKNA
jgi:hypothetical protein